MNLETVWSGAAERAGECQALSGYLGHSTLHQAEHVAPIVSETKDRHGRRTCLCCSRSKKRTAFGKDPRHPDRLRVICRTCVIVIFEPLKAFNGGRPRRER